MNALYALLMLTALAAPAHASGGGGSASIAEAGWRTVRYPDGGELRYLPPRVTEKDYARFARDAGVEGTSLLRLEVDRAGRIRDCGVLRSAGLPALDESACRIYRSRGRFQLRNIRRNLVLHAPVVWKLEQDPTAAPHWPAARPAELLQARDCGGGRQAAIRLGSGRSELIPVDELPRCLAGTFRLLSRRAVAIAGDPNAKVVVRARVGRGFSEVSLQHSVAGTRFVRQPRNVEPILDVLGDQWGDYRSPDGELGWSGFLLVIDGGQARLRFLSDEADAGDVWLSSNRIQEEFFPGTVFVPEPDG